MDTRHADAASLPEGRSRFRFSGWDGPAINVWVYRPETVQTGTPILFVMHGVERDARRYLDEWTDAAQGGGYILVAPEFSAKPFKGAEAYNQGNLGGTARGATAFSAIEPLFDEIRRRSGAGVSTYYLFGHSAGAQFVHRFVLTQPDARLEAAVAANAGWYTLPDRDAVYPEGLRETPVGRSALRAAFARDLTVLLGTADSDPGAANLKSGRVARRQGHGRLTRGQFFYDRSAQLAEREGAEFGWKLAYAPGVGHENSAIVPFAARLLFGGAPGPASGNARTFITAANVKGGCAAERPSELAKEPRPSPDSKSRLLVTTIASGAGSDVLAQGRLIDTGVQRLQAGACPASGLGRGDKAFLDIASIDAQDGELDSHALAAQAQDLAKRGADLVFVVNSGRAGRIERRAGVWMIHISGTSRLPRGTQVSGRRRSELSFAAALDVAGEPLGLKVRLYPISASPSGQARFESTSPGGMGRYADAAAHVAHQTSRNLPLMGGRDEVGGFIAVSLEGLVCDGER